MIRHLFPLAVLILNAGLIIAQSNTERAIAFTKLLEREQFDSCYATFDTVIANKISAEMVGRVWGSLNKNFGDYKGYLTTRAEKKDSLEKISLLCDFTKMKLDLNLVYNKAGRVVGFSFTPPKNTTAYRQPAYSRLGSFYEIKVNVQTGKYTLPGILCLPNNVSNPPVAILLSGSGPNDKDESIGPNKIFKDLALGLAANGIGTLRYDKRTLAYAAYIAANPEKFGIEEEVIEDALNAIKLVNKNAATKRSKLFIIGHSFGGYCAPLVASKSKAVHGIVLMAANARPLEDLITDQVNYLAAIDSVDAEEREIAKQLAGQVKIVKDKDALKIARAEDLPMGLPAFYWQSLNNYNQVQTAAKIKQPVLVLQGAKDYQVTMKDFELWKTNLSASPKNRFIIYDNLNHLFMTTTEGRSTPAEYEKQNNVEEKLITDISSWIRQQ